MDDMFGMLVNDSLTPERKLDTAISTGMADTVHTLIKTGGSELANAILQKANGRCALHIACQTGRDSYIAWLLDAGADPTKTDFFGMTALDLALRSGHERCVRRMLSACSNLSPANLWTAQTRGGSLSWRSFSDDIIAEMIIATPNLNRLRETVQTIGRDYLRDPAKHELLIRAYILTGNKLSDEDYAEIKRVGSTELTGWIQLYKTTVLPLQHMARLAVRQSVRGSVHYAVNFLMVPPRLKKYLILADQLNDSELLSIFSDR